MAPEEVTVSASRKALISSWWLRLVPALMVVAGCGAEVPPPDRAEARLEPRFRIGELDGEAALSDVLDVALGPNGLLYGTQWQSPSVTVFNEEGSVIRTIGRAGAGPGEFAQAGFVGFLGDSLWVNGRGRLALFSRDGELLDQVSFRNGLGDPRLSTVRRVTWRVAFSSPR